ncbi:MAG: phage tail protein [Oscillospiraceae bacterium]|nr:phage tail protein [Oscillospiraceae bacterium]
MPSHNFVVFIGVMPISFSKVSSVEINIESEGLMEGGENRYVRSLIKPVSSEKTMVLEKGIVGGGVAQSLLMSAANLFLRVGSDFDYITIIVLDQLGLPKKMYLATGCILKKRRLSELNAMSGEVLVESMEFIYEDLTEVPGVNLMFSSIQRGIKHRFSPPGKPFTQPLNPPPAPSPPPERFTPPLDLPPKA